MNEQKGKYSFHCGEVMKGCNWQTTADNKEELMAKVEEHGKRDHPSRISIRKPDTR